MYDAVHMARLIKLTASIMGRKHLGSISVTDYNPIIEDQRTGRMIAEFFYHACIGICQYHANLEKSPQPEEDDDTDSLFEKTIKGSKQ